MNKSGELLSNLVVYTKYAKYIPKQKRREDWAEICLRYGDMLVKKYPTLSDEIWANMSYIVEKRVLMSMRMAQFAGPAVEKNEARGYNCAYLPIDSYEAFHEIMFLLLGGTGVGYSVQKSHINELPAIRKPFGKERKYLISDDIEGWANSIKMLMKSYFGLVKSKWRFDFSDIRPKGARLVTAGGKAPGPEPLKRCLFQIELILERKKDGEKLTSIEVHDIICHIADAVLAGGIRRAALISLFSADDEDMLSCKAGNWWELNPQRGRANNSAVFVRNRPNSDKEFFDKFFDKIILSKAGEPGIYWTNDKDYGTNPCCEISLRRNTFCNLVEINSGTLDSIEDFFERARVGAFFATLQAGFTDFHYLRDIWRTNTERDALIGVGITGIADGVIYDLMDKHLIDHDRNLLKDAANYVKQENERVAKLIGINPAARTTTIKPSGTTSCVLGTASGIHAWHSQYYIRNMQCSVGDDLYNYFVTNHPKLIKIMDIDPKSAVIGIPMKAPRHSILREHESALELLQRVAEFNRDWVKMGHRTGPNTNNVSATISVKDIEWDTVRDWMWYNKDNYNGLSLLPYDGGTYKDAPFQECTHEKYKELMDYINEHPIDLTKIVEEEDNTDLKGEVACAGGACEITY